MRRPARGRTPEPPGGYNGKRLTEPPGGQNDKRLTARCSGVILPALSVLLRLFYRKVMYVMDTLETARLQVGDGNNEIYIQLSVNVCKKRG